MFSYFHWIRLRAETDGCRVSFAIPFDKLSVRFSVGFNQQSAPTQWSLHVTKCWIDIRHRSRRIRWRSRWSGKKPKICQTQSHDIMNLKNDPTWFDKIFRISLDCPSEGSIAEGLSSWYGRLLCAGWRRYSFRMRRITHGWSCCSCSTFACSTWIRIQTTNKIMGLKSVTATPEFRLTIAYCTLDGKIQTKVSFPN